MKKKDVEVGGIYQVRVGDKLVRVRITGESRYGGWDATNLHTKRTIRIRGSQRLRRRFDAPKDDATGTTTVPPVAAEMPVEAPAKEERGDAALPNAVAHAEPQPTGQEGDETMAKKVENGVIACGKCGRVIRLEKQKKGGYRGRCECGQGYAMGKRLLRLNGNLELPAATTVEQPKAPEKPAKAPRERADGSKMSGLDAAAKVLAEANEPLGCDEVVKRMLDGGLWTTSGKTPAATIYAAIIREIAKKGDASRFRKADKGKFTVAK